MHLRSKDITLHGVASLVDIFTSGSLIMEPGRVNKQIHCIKNPIPSAKRTQKRRRTRAREDVVEEHQFSEEDGVDVAIRMMRSVARLHFGLWVEYTADGMLTLDGSAILNELAASGRLMQHAWVPSECSRTRRLLPLPEYRIQCYPDFNYSGFIILSMRLFLIRHGETVDNVKGVYAGTLDSALTNHGTEQAQRLGESFAQNNVTFSHIFASPLSRAFKTAQAVRNAQPTSGEHQQCIEIVKAQELVERDYGPYEGRPYASKAQWMSTGSDGTEEAKGGVESAICMAKRCDTFLDRDLLPRFDEPASEQFVIAVVAHGMLLSHLWRRILLRMPKDSLSIAPEIIAARGNIVPERLGGWSNTGYLELSIRRDDRDETVPAPSVNTSQGAADDGIAQASQTPIPPPLQSEGADISVASPQPREKAVANKTSPKTLTGWSTIIVAIDSRKHLLGLKRQPGGIGSLANDQNQKKVDTFFKPLKLV